MNRKQSSACKAMGEEAQVGEQEPNGGTCDRGLEVFGEAAAAVEPGEAALDQLSRGQQLEAFDAGGALDDLDGPGAAIGERSRALIRCQVPSSCHR
jgi:hypothetical protein